MRNGTVQLLIIGAMFGAGLTLVIVGFLAGN